MTDFLEDIKRGKIGEAIFKEDFLDFLNIHYEDVSGCQRFQIIDTDFIAKIGSYEIKLNYKDNKQLIIETYTNINESYGKISLGWIYKTTADVIVFISKTSRTLIFLPFTEGFKNHFAKNIRTKYKNIYNKVSVNNNNKWQSAFMIIPFEDLKGFISVYKLIK